MSKFEIGINLTFAPGSNPENIAPKCLFTE